MYTSDLTRAAHTAQAVAKALGEPSVAVEELKELREMHLGVLQGFTAAEARQTHQQVWNRYRSDPLFVLPGGESTAGFTSRCAEAFERIARSHPNETVVVVTHGGVIDAFRRVWAPQDDRFMHCGNTGLCELVFDHGCQEFRVELWNCLRHLDFAGDTSDVSSNAVSAPATSARSVPVSLSRLRADRGADDVV